MPEQILFGSSLLLKSDDGQVAGLVQSRITRTGWGGCRPRHA